MARLAQREVADDVKALGGGLDVGVGELRTIRHGVIRAGHFDDDDADLGITGRDFGRREIASGDVVIVPEVQVNDLAARQHAPDLGGEDAEMGTAVGGGFRARMAGQDVQHAGAERAVLVLLAPHARRRVHQRREGAIGARQRPDARELLGVHAGILADKADGRTHIARFLNGRLDAGAQRVGLRVIVTPQRAMFDVDGFRQVGGQRDEAVVGDVIHPLDDFGNGAARAGGFALLLEQRDADFFFRARHPVLHFQLLRVGG